MNRYLLLLSAFAIYGCSTMHSEPTDISETEVKWYKLGMETGCRDAGRKRGDSQAKIDGFCGCMLDTLNKNLTFPQWQQATYFSQKRRDNDEMQIIGPHLRLVEACRVVP